jgi:hypothetical protein
MIKKLKKSEARAKGGCRASEKQIGEDWGRSGRDLFQH